MVLSTSGGIRYMLIRYDVSTRCNHVVSRTDSQYLVIPGCPREKTRGSYFYVAIWVWLWLLLTAYIRSGCTCACNLKILTNYNTENIQKNICVCSQAAGIGKYRLYLVYILGPTAFD